MHRKAGPRRDSPTAGGFSVARGQVIPLILKRVEGCMRGRAFAEGRLESDSGCRQFSFAFNDFAIRPNKAMIPSHWSGQSASVEHGFRPVVHYTRGRLTQ